MKDERRVPHLFLQKKSPGVWLRLLYIKIKPSIVIDNTGMATWLVQEFVHNGYTGNNTATILAHSHHCTDPSTLT